MVQRLSPKPTDVTAAFWAGTNKGNFLLQYDAKVGRCQFCPRPVSLFSNEVTQWRPASGRGTLIAITTCRIAAPGFEPPYQIGIVKLDEGPRVFAPVVGADQPPRIGARMQIVWDGETDEAQLYAVSPISAPRAADR